MITFPEINEPNCNKYSVQRYTFYAETHNAIRFNADHYLWSSYTSMKTAKKKNIIAILNNEKTDKKKPNYYNIFH